MQPAIVSYQQGLKNSARVKYEGLPHVIASASCALRLALRDIIPPYHPPDDAFLEACTDTSVCNRPEFVLNMRGNQCLAYIGDAYLTLSASKECYVSGHSPDTYQGYRSMFTSTAHMAAFYLHYFHDRGVAPATWQGFTDNQKLSARQAATFIEAILGEMVKLRMTGMADAFADLILQFRLPGVPTVVAELGSKRQLQLRGTTQ